MTDIFEALSQFAAANPQYRIYINLTKSRLIVMEPSVISIPFSQIKTVEQCPQVLNITLQDGKLILWAGDIAISHLYINQ